MKVLRQRKKRPPYAFTTGRPNTFSILLLQTTLPAPNPSQIWIEEQFGEREVEPNSALGQALRYVLRHWEGLMKFLTVAGAPLDNNVAERALKRAVLPPKNALFYKNEHGTMVGEILLSLIETCRLNKVSAWKRLLALARSVSAVRDAPSAYLPWKYARGE